MFKINFNKKYCFVINIYLYLRYNNKIKYEYVHLYVIHKHLQNKQKINELPV